MGHSEAARASDLLRPAPGRRRNPSHPQSTLVLLAAERSSADGLAATLELMRMRQATLVERGALFPVRHPADCLSGDRTYAAGLVRCSRPRRIRSLTLLTTRLVLSVELADDA
jgi:hypothetical protein